MRTARSLIVSPYPIVSHACPPPPGSNHAYPSPRQQPRMPPPEQPRTPPQEQPRMPPPEQRRTPPCGQNCWHTLLKILPCPNFVAGGKKHIYRNTVTPYRKISHPELLTYPENSTTELTNTLTTLPFLLKGTHSLVKLISLQKRIQQINPKIQIHFYFQIYVQNQSFV